MPKFCLLPLVTMGLSLALSSCALPTFSSQPAKPITFSSGTRVEVRKAVAAHLDFDPKDLHSLFYVVGSSPDAPFLPANTPPLLAAANGSTHTVRTTAYCHTEADHLAYGSRNAAGGRLKFGAVRSAAADWSRYPLGTVFRIVGQPGVLYEVDDYGSALVGTGTIDLYKPTQSQMRSWGVRHVDIEVIRWGSYERSYQLLKDRTRHPHVRQMYHSIYRYLQLPPTHLTTSLLTPPLLRST
jgi:3D (Asp-Asp-Asp) domain-containing protein